MNKIKFFSIILFISFFIIIFLFFWDSNFFVIRKKITIKGSETILALNYQWSRYYTKKNPEVSIEITGGGSGVGISSIINRIVSIASSSRRIRKSEIKRIKKMGKTVKEVVIALDSIIIYVNKSNPINTITLNQLQEIYLGKIQNWKEVGGKDEKINLYGRESSSGTYGFFKKKVLNKEDYYNRVISLAGNATIINAIRKDEKGIGYASFSMVKDIKKLAIKVKNKEIYPSEKFIKNKKYPLIRNLYYYFIVEDLKNEFYVFDYINWIKTKKAQSFCIRTGYFPVNIV